MSSRSRLTSPEAEMDRVTVRVGRDTLSEIESAVERGEFHNRSQAIRAYLREQLQHEEQSIERNTVYDQMESTQ